MSSTGAAHVVHRPGALKQQNKRFKTGRHRSQHEIKRSTKGRVAEKKHARSLKRLNTTTKQERVNTAIQIRKQKLQENRQTRQTIGAIDGVPQIITVIPLSSDINIFSIVELLTNSLGDNKSTDVATQCGARIYTSPKLRSKFCFLTPTPTNLENILDAAKVSDTIIYVISASHGISIEGDYLLDVINVHCVNGNVIYSVVSSSNDDSMSTTSSRLSSSRNLEKFLEKRFSNVKLVPLDNEQDGQRLLRKLIEQKLTKPSKRCLRSYLFAQEFSFEDTKSTTSTLKISGYLRGLHLSPNDLVYIPSLGTFQLEKIEQHQFQRDLDGIIKPVIEKTYLPQTDLQRSLAFEAESDPMNNDQEQTWPTAEELQQAQAEQHQLKKRVPKGTSEYQAAWIVSDEEDNNSIGQEKDFEDDQQDMMTANADDLESIQLDQEEEEEEEEEEEMDEIVINKNNYDDKFDLE
jgi:pre-rRNA-processing protein TSR1